MCLWPRLNTPRGRLSSHHTFWSALFWYWLLNSFSKAWLALFTHSSPTKSPTNRPITSWWQLNRNWRLVGVSDPTKIPRTHLFCTLSLRDQKKMLGKKSSRWWQSAMKIRILLHQEFFPSNSIASEHFAESLYSFFSQWQNKEKEAAGKRRDQVLKLKIIYPTDRSAPMHNLTRRHVADFYDISKLGCQWTASPWVCRAWSPL